MDSLTQIALGIATAHAVAGKQLQRKAYVYGAILGTIPDLDVAIGYFMSPVNAVAFHRGISHSLFFMMVAAPIFGWLVSIIEKRKITFWRATILVFLCLFTHVFLDLFTSWGTQIFWPNEARVAWKTIFVIDPLYTLPLLFCLILAYRKADFFIRNRWIWKGIWMSSAYLVITCCIKIFALRQFEEALQSKKIAYKKIIVKPTAFNCIVWNANVSTEEGYLLSDYSLFDSQPIAFQSYQKNNLVEQKLAGNPDFETLKKVSEGWFTVSEKNGLYHFNDLRFGMIDENPNNPQFAFSYVFKEKNGTLQAEELPKKSRQGAKLLKKLLTRIKGN